MDYKIYYRVFSEELLKKKNQKNHTNRGHCFTSLDIREGTVKVCLIEDSLAHADWGQCPLKKTHIA